MFSAFQSLSQEKRVALLFGLVLTVIPFSPAQSAERVLRGPSPSPSSISPDQRLERGRAAYNEQRFQDAMREFTALVQQRPEVADGYRRLGSSAQLAQRFEIAALAYQRYLKLAPRAKDQATIREQLSAVQGLIEGRSLVRLRRQWGAKIKEAQEALNAGRLDGPQGAVARYLSLVEEGIFSPSLTGLQKGISEKLIAAGERALDDYWRPDRQASESQLRGQLEPLALWLRGGVFDDAMGRRLSEKQRELDALLGAVRRDESAAQRLAAAGSHPAIRFTLLLTLIEGGKLSEAKTLGENLLMGNTVLSQSGRLRAVMAHIRLQEKRDDERGLSSLREALFIQESW